MVLNLKQLYDISGTSTAIDYVVGSERTDEISGYEFTNGIKVSGKAANRAGILMLELTTSFTLSAECDRCLRRFEREYSFESEYVLVRSLSNPDEDNDEYVVTDGDELDLDELVVSDAIVQIPTKMLCKDDCKGLCTSCGADLNSGECGCQKSAVSSRIIFKN